MTLEFIYVLFLEVYALAPCPCKLQLQFASRFGAMRNLAVTLLHDFYVNLHARLIFSNSYVDSLCDGYAMGQEPSAELYPTVWCTISAAYKSIDRGPGLLEISTTVSGRLARRPWMATMGLSGACGPPGPLSADYPIFCSEVIIPSSSVLVITCRWLRADEHEIGRGTAQFSGPESCSLILDPWPGYVDAARKVDLSTREKRYGASPLVYAH